MTQTKLSESELQQIREEADFNNYKNNKEMTIQEGNEIIAVFDGYVQEHDKNNKPYWHPGRNITQYTYPNGFKYHSSWDCLMPVVQKFMSIPMEAFNYNAKAMMELRQCKAALSGLSITDSIETVLTHLLANIQWYNSLTPTCKQSKDYEKSRQAKGI